MKINKKILDFFSNLADETRLKILVSLVDEPQTVTQIHSKVNKDLSLSAISHQLHKLEDNCLIICNKKGREKYFSLSSDFCWCILKDAFSHFDGHKCKKCLNIKNNKLR